MVRAGTWTPPLHLVYLTAVDSHVKAFTRPSRSIPPIIYLLAPYDLGPSNRATNDRIRRL